MSEAIHNSWALIPKRTDMATSREYNQEQVMLSLAAIAYRGFELVQPSAHKQALMHNAMSECLHELSPVKDQWQIVWGPASFSPFGIGFADTAVYIAQSRVTPCMYVVAIRGTNPVCLFDWLFCDFMVSRQVPWKYGNPAEIAGAQISFSTALSLGILQHLRSHPPHDGIVDSIRDVLSGVLTAIRRKTRPVPEGLRDALSLIPEMNANFVSKILETLNGRSPYQIPGTARNAWEESAARIQAQKLDFPASLISLIQEEESFFEGIDLRSFLASKVANEPKIEIYVTGHSKGATLSSTLALWLADTQGELGVPDEDRWDPMRRATIYAYSFAGPTAGNEQFARHSDNVIGPRCYRTVNERDIAPRAWMPRDLRQIPALFQRDPERRHAHDAVETFLQLFGELDYEQIGNNVQTRPSLLHSDLLFDEIIYQHLDAYFEQLGLEAEMSASTFFTPLVLSDLSPQ